MNHNIINEKTNLVSYGLGYNMYKDQHVCYELGYWYHIVMVFNTKAHTKIDTLVYPYIPTQH
jgi:hypothetical protein